ncbi:unnamed protein product [Pieris brassicae]|uniref:Large ribosomal subunit protein P2 n=2 Tax=Pieris TaxID=7115 RepID=A0A9P0TH73_PIEBR|nr:unnamed protein product [Pieris brassicae]
MAQDTTNTTGYQVTLIHFRQTVLAEIPTQRLTFNKRFLDLKMRYVAAYLLAVLGGKASPAAADIEKILSSVGIEADSEKLKNVISKLEGKTVDDLIAEGREKLSSMPAGGAAPAAAAAAAPAAAAEDKKEEKEAKKEESESEDEDMGFGLFD